MRRRLPLADHPHLSIWADLEERERRRHVEICKYPLRSLRRVTWYTIPGNYGTRLEITCIPDELPRVKTWILAGDPTVRFPCAEFREAHWGPDYRTAAADLVWRVYEDEIEPVRAVGT